jgi:hypothetical protein
MYILKVCSEFQRLLAEEDVAISLLSFIVKFWERNFGDFAHLSAPESKATELSSLGQGEDIATGTDLYQAWPTVIHKIGLVSS